MKVMVLIVLMASGLLFQPIPSSAAERRVALVIGNAAYEAAGTLRNPLNDAADITASLKKVGFDVIVGTDLTGDKFAAVVNDFAAAARDADAALFYYSGHGMQLNAVNYLLPVDFHAASEIELKRQAIDLGDIIAQMEATAKVNLVFLDACRDNPLAEMFKKTIVASGRSALLSRGLAPVNSGDSNTMIVFATAPGKTAADGDGRNSPFTSAVLQNISSPGIEVETLMKRVSKTVSEITRNEQLPERLSKLKIEFYFQPSSGDGNKGAPETSVEVNEQDFSKETAFWKGIENSNRSADFEDYLSMVSSKVFSGLFSTLAEKRIASLSQVTKANPAQEIERSTESETKSGGVEFPSVITTSGRNGNNQVEGAFTQTSPGNWEERNSENTGAYYFKALEHTSSRIVLFDKSRNLYLRIDLKKKTTAWRMEGQKNWNPLYDVVAVK